MCIIAYTETHVEAENDSLQKESPLPGVHFSGSMLI